MSRNGPVDSKIRQLKRKITTLETRLSKFDPTGGRFERGARGRALKELVVARRALELAQSIRTAKRQTLEQQVRAEALERQRAHLEAQLRAEVDKRPEVVEALRAVATHRRRVDAAIKRVARARTGDMVGESDLPERTLDLAEARADHRLARERLTAVRARAYAEITR